MRKLFVVVLILGFFTLGIQNLNAAEIVKVSLSFNKLTDTSFEFSVTSDPSIDEIEYDLLNDSLTKILSGKLKLSSGGGTLRFTKLKPNTEYVVKLSKNNETLLEIPFKTFGYIDGLYGFRLFYFIDLTDTKTSRVRVTIFGQFNGGSTFSIGRYNYHLTDEAMILATNPKVSFYETSARASSMVVASKRLIYIYP